MKENDLVLPTERPWDIAAKTVAVFVLFAAMFGSCSPSPAYAEVQLKGVKAQACVSPQMRVTLAKQYGWRIIYKDWYWDKVDHPVYDRKTVVIKYRVWKQRDGRLLATAMHSGKSCVIGIGKTEPDVVA